MRVCACVRVNVCNPPISPVFVSEVGEHLVVPLGAEEAFAETLDVEDLQERRVTCGEDDVIREVQPSGSSCGATCPVHAGPSWVNVDKFGRVTWRRSGKEGGK